MASKKEAQEIIIPDEAISYIMGRYLQGKNIDGSAPIIVGIPTTVVEDILQLFIDWANSNGYVKNGIMTIGGHKVG